MKGSWRARRDSDGKRVKILVSAQSLLSGAVQRAGYDPDHYGLFEIWDRLLGREAEKARAVGLKGGRLYVEVDTSVRMHGLALRKRDLLKKLNAAFGGTGPISDIIFRPGGVSLSDEK